MTVLRSQTQTMLVDAAFPSPSHAWHPLGSGKGLLSQEHAWCPRGCRCGPATAPGPGRPLADTARGKEVPVGQRTPPGAARGGGWRAGPGRAAPRRERGDGRLPPRAPPSFGPPPGPQVAAEVTAGAGCLSWGKMAPAAVLGSAEGKQVWTAGGGRERQGPRGRGQARHGWERRCPGGAALRGAAPHLPLSTDRGEEGAQDPPFLRLLLLLFLLSALPQPLPLSSAPRRLPPPPPALCYTEAPLSAGTAGGAASSALPLPRGRWSGHRGLPGPPAAACPTEGGLGPLLAFRDPIPPAALAKAGGAGEPGSGEPRAWGRRRA